SNQSGSIDAMAEPRATLWIWMSFASNRRWIEKPRIASSQLNWTGTSTPDVPMGTSTVPTRSTFSAKAKGARTRSEQARAQGRKQTSGKRDMPSPALISRHQARPREVDWNRRAPTANATGEDRLIELRGAL